MDLYEFMQESNARARRGRALGRWMILVALVAIAFPAFLFIAAPNGPSAMFADPGPIRLIVPGIGVLGMVVGLVWMVRILRADPEPDARSWRYRDF